MEKSNLSINEKHHNELIKQWQFSSHSLTYQALCRPSQAAMIIFNRLKYRLTGTPTITNTNLFFEVSMNIKFPEQVSEILFMHHYFEIGLTTMLTLVSPAAIIQVLPVSLNLQSMYRVHLLLLQLLR